MVERKTRHLLEVARALMFTMNIPQYLWSEATLTAYHLINRFLSKTLQFQMPISCLHSTYPMFRGGQSLPLKTFGCTVFVHDMTPSPSKLALRAHKCVFVGYSLTQRGYKCHFPSMRRIIISMDVSFHESVSFFPSSQSGEEWWIDQTSSLSLY